MSPSDPRLKALQACEMSLYQSRDSLVEAVQYIESQAPLGPQDVFPMLMVYHNSLIKELQRNAEEENARRASLVKSDPQGSGRVLAMDRRKGR